MAHLKIQRQYDIERENRGWTIDNITLFIDDEPAGYINIQNITEENFKKFYPNGFYDYLRQIAGYSLPADINELSINDISGYRLRYTNENFNALTGPQKIKELIRNNPEKHQIYKDFLKYNLNRPFVAYSSIHGEHDRHKIYPINQEGKKDVVFEDRSKYGSTVSFKNRGLGKVLYVEAGNMLAENNLSLHKSQCISDSANNLWDKLQKEYPESITIKNNSALRDKKDVIFSSQNIEDYIPDWIDTVEYTTIEAPKMEVEIRRFKIRSMS